MVAKGIGLEKVTCRLGDHLKYLCLSPFRKGLSHFSDAVPNGPVIGLLPCLGLHGKTGTSGLPSQPPTSQGYGYRCGSGKVAEPQGVGTERPVAERGEWRKEQTQGSPAPTLRQSGNLPSQRKPASKNDL